MTTETQQSETYLSLAQSELRYRRLFEAAQDGILILDAQTGAITDVNPYMVSMLGYSRDEFIQKKLWEVGAFRDIEASKDAFLVLQREEYIRYRDLPLKARDGRLVQVEFVSNVYQAGSERVIQCNIRDITDRKHAHDALVRSEAILREESVRDHLTGLFNRRYLEETLQRELDRAYRKHLTMGLIMLDTDNLKRFNDTWGHAAGDGVLKELGILLLGQFRGEDVACRYGGDEFVILLPDTTLKSTYERAEKLCEYAKRHSHIIEGQAYQAVSLSLGVAAFPQHGSSSDTLMRAIDAALYHAKHEGRGRVVIAE